MHNLPIIKYTGPGPDPNQHPKAKSAESEEKNATSYFKKQIDS